MLIDETDDELFDRIESLIYILGERMDADVLKSKVDDVVMNALSDIEMERKSA